ncbi:GAF domain-containing protein [Mycobacterium stomatepiae]|nr:GAF domain-containing protein [Mycobacterium stomatepiae]
MTTRAPSTTVRAAHGLFVTGEVDAAYLEAAKLPRVIVESWQRSLATGVNPDCGAKVATAAGRLTALRNAHPLAEALPVVRRLLVDHASDSGVAVAITSADGMILWVEGDADVCRKATAMNFVPGADWSERGAGTNAPGTALALDREIQIRACEHFSRPVQRWNCTATPLHDRRNGELLGSLDLTGGASVASSQTLALVRAVALAIENHLALLTYTQPQPPPTGARLTVLGPDRPAWETTDDVSGPRRKTLTGRHADILVLLIRHPEGLSADHLAYLLDEKELDVVTIRAEMSRLRKVIGEAVLASRPYRLLTTVCSDMDDVIDLLRSGDLHAALDRYTGSLLPRSVSPAIARLRSELSASLREAVLSESPTGDPRLLRRWLDLPEARDDRQGWRTLIDHRGAAACIRAEARGHLVGLDADLA